MRTVRDALRRQVIDHLSRRAGTYFLAALVFAVGVALGAMATGALDDTQRLELVHYVDFFLQGLRQRAVDVDPHDLFRRAVVANLRTAALIYALGLTVVGAPLCLLVLLARGFVSGFAVAFLVGHKGWTGLVLTLLAILPQHVIAVPALVVLAVAALGFAGQVVRRRRLPGSPWRHLAAYTLTAVGCALALLAASLVEGYLAPAWLTLLARLAG